MTRIHRRRRHILYFQRHIRSQSPFALTISVDATAIQTHRREGLTEAPSHVAYLILAVSQTLSRHPDLCVVPTPGLIPRLQPAGGVRPKIALDGMHDNQRVTYSVVLPATDGATLAEINGYLGKLRECPLPELPETAGARKAQNLPKLFAWPLFRLAVGHLRQRTEILGTVSISSLGRYQVNSFIASGGTPVTINAGQIIDRAVAIDGMSTVRPIWNLTLVFDHRLLDGARAAEIAEEIKRFLERGHFQ